MTGPIFTLPFETSFDAAIDVLVAVFEKDRLAPVAARRDMVRTAGNGDAW